MITRNELARFAEVCAAIGSEVADDDGFVPVRKLLARFHANLMIRPLLVEGMLASIDRHSEVEATAGRWAVLVDSETYSVSKRAIEEESSTQPLPSRFRNTVAHELAHSLAFRPSEFGIQLRGQIDNEESQKELVKAIERETEQLSPLLLLPDKAIGKFLSGKKQALSIEDFVLLYRSMGVSRYLLIRRLGSLRPTNDLRNRDGLKDIAIGIGKWIDGRNAVLKGWPVFMNFDKNIIPTFLLKLVDRDFLPAMTVFPDESFAMCGGPNNTIELETDAGVTDAPNSGSMKIQCSIENVNRKAEAEFLYVVRKQVVRQPEKPATKKDSSVEVSQLQLFHCKT